MAAFKLRTQVLGLAVLCALVLGLLPAMVWAIDDPDDLDIVNIRAYTGVVDSGDMLVVVKYDIEYATLPEEATNLAYIARLMTGDDVELQSTVPFPFNDSGYGEGVVSFYFRATQMTALDIDFDGIESNGAFVQLQGNPGLFTAPPVVTNGAIIRRDPDDGTITQLENDVLELATQLEVAWSDNAVDLFVGESGENLLTETGAEYFTNAIPNLRLMVPDIFASSLLTPDINKRSFTNSYTNELKGFLDGTLVDTSFTSLSDTLSMPKLMVSTGFLFMIIAGVIWAGIKLTGQLSFGLLMGAFVLPIGVLNGFGSLTFVAVLTFFAILWIGHAVWYRST